MRNRGLFYWNRHNRHATSLRSNPPQIIAYVTPILDGIFLRKVNYSLWWQAMPKDGRIILAEGEVDCSVVMASVDNQIKLAGMLAEKFASHLPKTKPEFETFESKLC
jgi:hypothetical protein